ncbi:MAG: acyltransferase family protein [Deltaproteobacteria bacterium]|nr:acyltransferase family protein [Deltaproteobacteria bacterium]MBT6432063.1 acyltransferase family protein [Deltaproteobacteria bacterium]MBT6490560.1 acyltransferase family protein [Deltaproteobacteria bacterium]
MTDHAANESATNDPRFNKVAWSRFSEQFLPYDIDSLENRDEAFIAEVSRRLAHLFRTYFSFQPKGFERIPEGAGLYVANHNGGALTPDTLLFSSEIIKEKSVDDVPYALAHQAVMQMPGFHQLFSKIGGMRACHENAAKVFGADKKVLVYPGGDEDVFRPYRKRNEIVFGGRTGYIRLALRENVPVIPVVTAGAHETFMVLEDMKWFAKLIRSDKWMRLKVWPLVLSFPWGLTFGVTPPHIPVPSPIHMEVIKPFYFDRSGEEAASDDDYVRECAAQVEEAMEDSLKQLAAERQAAIRSIFN